MKIAALGLLGLLLWQAEKPVQPEARHLEYQRAVTVAAGPGTAACAVLEGSVYAHSHTLNDVRLFAGDADIPYALSTSQTALGSDPAQVLNLGAAPQGQIGLHGVTYLTFDLEMPSRPYSSVTLDLAGQDFLATARVSGRASTSDRGGTYLGSFTLFDLTAQRLSRNTTLALTEATFPILHIELAVSPAPAADATPHAGFDPAMVRGASVPPSRQAQTLYTTLLTTRSIVQRGRQSIATFDLPAGVPVERISFDLQPADHTNFSREVRLVATVPFDNGQQPEPSEEIAGNISRVQLTEAGQQVRSSQLSVPATFGINQHAAAKVEVAVLNGDDRPLALESVRLEMRERKLCFDVPAPPVTMRYGDPQLQPPVYDYARIFNPAAPVRTATLGPEEKNPAYAARTEHRSFTERHPEVIWLALLGVVAALGIVAFRSAKHIHHP